LDAVFPNRTFLLRYSGVREAKTEKFSRTVGKTPAISAEKIQKLFSSIDTSNVLGPRDRG
jgi:hypothetical protein